MGDLKDIKRWGKKAKPHFFALEPRMLFDGVSIVPSENIQSNSDTSSIDQHVALDFSHDLAAQTSETIAPEVISVTTQETVPSNSLSTNLANIQDVMSKIDFAQGGVIRDATNPKEILFIDSAVRDISTLVLDTRSDIEIIMLGSEEDPWLQMTNALSRYQDIQAVHIISHGSEAQMILSGRNFTNENLAQESAYLNSWKNYLADSADILIYGCDVAAGSDGNLFISNIASLTNRDVNASSNTTGQLSSGGDWILESSIGQINSDYFYSSKDTINNYQDTLVALSGPPADVTWYNVFKSATYDPSDDQQANSGQDLVGNASNAMLQATNVPITGDVIYYFRARYGDNAVTGTSFYLAIDFKGASSSSSASDGIPDFFIEAQVAANGSTKLFLHQRDATKSGTGPSSTGWLNSNSDTTIQLQLTTDNSYVAVSSVSLGSNVTVIDLDGGGTDSWLTFGFKLSAIKNFTTTSGTYVSAAINETSPLVFYAFTSTSQTSNGDIAGINDKTANLNDTWQNLLGASVASSLTTLTSITSNDPPTVTSGATASFAENATGTVYTVTGTDPDAGTTLTYAMSGTDAALFNIDSSTGAITFKTPPNYESPTDNGANNVYNITVTASDGSLTSTTQNVAITVEDVSEGGNHPPVASDLSIEVNQNDTTSGNLPSATDPENDPITYALVGGEYPVHGTVVINQDGTYTYTPNHDFVGLDSFNYSVDDGANGINQYTVTVTVKPVNQAPIAEDVITSTNEDTVLTDYLPVAIDLEGNTISYVIGSQPSHGQAKINYEDFNGVNYTYTYTPNPNFSGTDSFTYIVRDSLGAEATYTVTIDVKPSNDPPTSQDLVVTTPEDEPYIFSLSDFSFTDLIEGDTFEAVKITGLPNNGTLELNGDSVIAGQSILVSDISKGLLVFKPLLNAASENDGSGNLLAYDNFYFQVQDSGGTLNDGQDLSSTHVIEIKVTPVNDAPSLSGTQADLLNGLEDTSYTVFANELLQGYSDPDLGDVLSIHDLSAGEGFIIVHNSLDDSYTITPPENFNGEVQLTYKVSDGTMSVDATRTFFMDAVNDAPTSQDITITFDEDVTYTFKTTDFGISDVEDNTLSAIKITGLPNNGVLKLNGNLVTTDQLISAKDLGDGLLTFTPLANDNGTPYDSFYFQVKDDGGVSNGGVDISEERIVTINVTPVNDPADVTGDVDTKSIREAGGIDNGTNDTPTINGSLTISDVDSSETFQAVVTETASERGYGTYTIDANGNYTYTLDNNNAEVQALNENDTLTDTFTVLAADGTQQQVTITINGANDAAIITGKSEDSVTEAGGINNLTPGNPIATGNLIATDVDNAASFIALTEADATYGKFSISENGAWTYTLDNENLTIQGLNIGDTLTDTFTVTTVDGTTKDITITIRGSDDALHILGDTSGTIIEAGGVNNETNGTPSLTGKLNTIDFDNNVANTFRAVTTETLSDKGYGNFTINTYGVWTYTLNNADLAVQGLNVGDTLEDTFTVRTEDGTEQIITITITGSNDAAIITGDTSGNVIEAGGTNNNNLNNPTASGKLNVTDVDDPASFTVVNDELADYGSFTIDSTGGWIYKLDNNNPDIEALNDGETLTDVFTVTAADGTTQEITITITGTNDAPKLSGPLANLPNGSQGSFYTVSVNDLLQGYTDPEGDALSVLNLNAGEGFVVVDNGDGTFTIKPPLNYNGPVNLTYQVSDGRSSVDATQTFTLLVVNRPPELTGEKAILSSGEEDLSYTVSVNDLLQGYTDPEGDALSVLNLNAGEGFVVVDNGDGTFTIKPPLNYNGPVNLTYQVSDGRSSVDATQTFTLAAVNDAPEGKDSTFTIIEDMPYILNVGDFGFADVDSGDSLSTITINTLPLRGTLTLNGEAVYVGQVISADLIRTGALVFTPSSKEGGLAYANFSFQVGDQSGALDPISRTATFNVVNMNSTTTLSRKEIFNVGFEINKKIEAQFHLNNGSETAQVSLPTETSDKLKVNGANAQLASDDALFYVTSPKAFMTDPSVLEVEYSPKQLIEKLTADTILRNVIPPPNPVTDNQGRVVYQLPQGVFRGGLGTIKLIATKKDGSPLPPWIRFDSKTGQLIAEVPKDMRVPLEIKVEAIDFRSNKAEATFKIYPRPHKISFTGKHSLSSQFKNAFHLNP